MIQKVISASCAALTINLADPQQVRLALHHQNITFFTADSAFMHPRIGFKGRDQQLNSLKLGIASTPNDLPVPKLKLAGVKIL